MEDKRIGKVSGRMPFLFSIKQSIVYSVFRCGTQDGTQDGTWNGTQSKADIFGLHRIFTKNKKPLKYILGCRTILNL